MIFTLQVQNMVNSFRYTYFPWRTEVNKQLRVESFKHQSTEGSISLIVSNFKVIYLKLHCTAGRLIVRQIFSVLYVRSVLCLVKRTKNNLLYIEIANVYNFG